MTALFLSPILAISMASATLPAAGQAGTASAVTVARAAESDTPVFISELRGPESEPPSPAAAPAAPRAPAATTHRAPRVHAVAPLPPAADPNSVIGIIEAAAARWGVSGSWMVGIARCESGLRTNAYNPRGPYIGLFQFLASTFRANGGTNIYDAADQSNIAAKMLAHGQAHQWSCA